MQDQGPRGSGRTCASVHARADGGSLAYSRTLFDPCPRACSGLSPGVAAFRARRLRKEHIARRCPLTDIAGPPLPQGALGPRHFYRHHVLRETRPHQSRAAIATRRRKRLLLVGGLVVFVVVVGLSGLSAYHSALRAKTSLGSARTVISNDLSNRQAFRSSVGRAKLASDIKRWMRMPTTRRRSSRDPSE